MAGHLRREAPYHEIVRAFLIVVSFSSLAYCYHAPPSFTRPQLISTLQSCYTSHQLLDRVGRFVSHRVDVDGSLASLVWVRLCKLLVHESNHINWKNGTAAALTSYTGLDDDALSILGALALQMPDCRRRGSTAMNTDAAVELTKAAGVCSRILCTSVPSDVYRPIAQFWDERAQRQSTKASDWKPQHLSGLKWAYDSLSLGHPCFELPEPLKKQYAALDLPFRIIPGCISSQELSVQQLIAEVDYKLDEIRTSSNQTVRERRKTAWQGDDGVADFAYSGKSMVRQDWSPLVEEVRNQLHASSQQYYDCCLLNLYPDGESGMRYHIDPDQGLLWDFATTVVSVGSTRRVAFRPIPTSQRSREDSRATHSFHVLHGDAMLMFRDCQARYQHTVKKAEFKGDGTPRASLVFKRTWNDANLP